jgi:sugar phosphate isomerase/epimerase
MEIGICEWNPQLTPRKVSALRKQGVTVYEPGAPFFMERDSIDVENDRDMLVGAGIKIYSCHAPLGPEYDLSMLDGSDRAKAVATHLTAISRTALLGARCLVIHPGDIAPADEMLKRIDNLYLSLDALVSRAEQEGVCLALENMPPGYIGAKSILVRRVVDGFNSRALGVCFDTGHAHMNDEGLLNAYERLKERIVTFHLHDNDGKVDEHVQPPYGTVDWHAFVDAVKPAEIDYPIIVESEVWQGADWSFLLNETRALLSGEALLGPCGKCGHYRVPVVDRMVCGCNTGMI